MTAKGVTLAEQVATLKDRLEGVERTALFSPQVQEAMLLADLFDSIKPKEYVLPLDILAGFPVGTNVSTKC